MVKNLVLNMGEEWMMKKKTKSAKHACLLYIISHHQKVYADISLGLLCEIRGRLLKENFPWRLMLK